jgi:hypothetical protein
MTDATPLDRCLWDVTGLAREKWVTVGDNAHGGRARVAAAGSINGYRWLGSRLIPIDCLPYSDFSSYATRWEQRYSVLNPNRTGSLKFAPVVSDKSLASFSFPITGSQAAFPIVAHYGTVSVDEIIVLRKFATSLVSGERRKALERLLDQGIKTYVEQGYPDAGDWGPFSDTNNIGPNKFTVLTDPEGLILACLDAYGSEPGLESEDPISYLMLAPALLELATVGGRVVWRMVSQRAARKAAQRALAGEIETLTLEELETIRGGSPSARGPLMSAEELNRPVPQIREGMGEKLMLTDAERKGAREILNVLERIRANPKDAPSLWGQIANRAKPMKFGKWAREGWTEIDVLPGNPGGLNKIRLVVRVANGDLEAKLLQVHGGSL